MYKYYPKKRYQKTIDFVEQHINKEDKILDLGVENPLSVQLKRLGYSVFNTTGEDLDLNISAVLNKEYEVVSAFQILEHLVSPYVLLKSIQAKKLVASIPLKLWFAKAYRNKDDIKDCHFHEFESWQFDWLLEKSGWRIISRKKWTNPRPFKLGFRPILRFFTPRYYIVYAERVN
ncbi:MAG: methyltransferase [Flavobacteriaceae bacterium]